MDPKREAALLAVVEAAREILDEGDGSRALADAFLALDALTTAGYVLVPAEMTEAQARASLAGHALADRLRDTNPAEFANVVKLRQATWRQLVKAMGE